MGTERIIIFIVGSLKGNFQDLINRQSEIRKELYAFV